jgi:succinate dehydrogenase/fumarate reductase flavoprotein subunit
MSLSFDCIVVGSGHAGSTAALSAAESGCRKVLLIDKCPPEWAGGNGYFTAGAHRTVHAGLHDLLPLVKNVRPEDVKNIDMEPYTKEQFTSDIMRLGGGRSSPELVEVVVDDSRATIEWLAKHVEVPFTFSFNRQAYEVNGRKVFWGGMVLSVRDGGKGLVAAHHAALARAGIEIWFNTCATELVMHGGAVQGLIAQRGQESLTLQSPAVVLAMGGFEASPEMRVKHLGPEWKGAMVMTYIHVKTSSEVITDLVHGFLVGSRNTL